MQFDGWNLNLLPYVQPLSRTSCQCTMKQSDAATGNTGVIRMDRRNCGHAAVDLSYTQRKRW